MRIDYRDLKERARILELLASMGWKSTEGRGEQLRGPCPLPGCTSGRVGKSPSRDRNLSINTRKNIYRCFSCNSAGNVLNFWQAYRKLQQKDAAIELHQRVESTNRNS
jgi:hypothetical protein